MENPNPIGASASSFSYLGRPMAMPMFDSASAAAAPSGVLGGNLGGHFASAGGLAGLAFGGGGIGVGASSSATCQDCGNQAKKDCSHRRCRTCCKSRGFDCATHVKSTWVSASRRRERLQTSAAAAMASGGDAGGFSSASTSVTKKPRLIVASSDAPPAATATGTTNTIASRTSTSNTATPPRSFETTSSHQDAANFRESLPGQVRAPAVFKCVRVTTVDNGEDEFAYQAMVRIGGHVFKGFLYNQGVEAAPGITNTGGHNAPLGSREDDGGSGVHRNGSSRGMPNISDLHLGGAAVGGGSSDAYTTVAGGGGGLMGGTSYGNPVN